MQQPVKRTYGKRAKEQSPPRPAAHSSSIDSDGDPGAESKKSRLEEGTLLLASSALASRAVGRIRAQLEEFSYHLVSSLCDHLCFALDAGAETSLLPFISGPALTTFSHSSHLPICVPAGRHF